MHTAALPRYACHKEVHALKITEVRGPGVDGSYCLVHPHDEPDLHTTRISEAWFEKHQPQVGGYLVQYPGDGYQSYSPADAFESGYTLIIGRTAPLTRNQLQQAAIHFKTERNRLRDAVLGFLGAYGRDLRTVDDVDWLIGGLNQPDAQREIGTRGSMELLRAVRPTMDGPGMGGTPIMGGGPDEAAPAPPAPGAPHHGLLFDADGQPVEVTGAAVTPQAIPVVHSDDPVTLEAHAETRDGVRGIFVPEDECVLFATSLASLAEHAEATGAWPRLQAAFKALLKIITERDMVEGQ